MEKFNVAGRQDTRVSSKNRPVFALQWHLTTACPNNCRHCYVKRNSRILSLRDCMLIIDDFQSLLKKWSCDGQIYFTGGDPLLYPRFFQLLAYTHRQNPDITIGILGNPELLTNAVGDRLKREGVYSYQMSLDGMEKTHDRTRHPGSFQNTIGKLDLLKKNGIKTAIMTTVNKTNLEEIPSIVDLIIKSGVDIFDFHRFIPIGNGENVKEDAQISPLEFRRLLSEVNTKYQEYINCSTFLGREDPLWELFYLEKGLLKKSRKSALISGGCVIGCSELTILEDGTVLSCRRLPIPIGRVPKQTLRDIFIVSPLLNKMREINKIQRCRECSLISHCRGCRAMAYAVKGDYFAADPQCWR